MISATLSFLCFVSTGTAFYPYSPVYSPQDKSTVTSSLAARDNKYTIIDAPQTKRPNSAAVAQDGNDISYMATVSIGSEGAQYRMLLDSAGSVSWVFGSDCTTQACQNHNTFGTANSNSLNITSNTFNVGYGTGNVNGVLATDNVTVAGLTVPLTFGLASDATPEFLSYPMDGILSIGRASSSDYSTITDALSQQALIPSRLVGIHLSRDVHGVNGNDGEVDFGTPDTSLYSGNLAYTLAIPDSSFWEVPVDGAGVDGNPADVGPQRTAILDTGTSYTYLPPSDVQAIFSLIPGSSQNGENFSVPCNTQSTVQVSISNINYNISYQDLVGDSTDGGSTCSSKIIGRQIFGPNQWLLGDVFLKNVYTVFDSDQNRVGFGAKAANANDNPSTSSSTSSTGSVSTSVPSNSATATSTGGSSVQPAAVSSTSSKEGAGVTRYGGSLELAIGVLLAGIALMF